MSRKPVLFDLDAEAEFDPSSAPPPPDLGDDPPAEGRAMAVALRLGQKRVSRAAKLGWAALSGFVLLVASVAAWDFVAGLLARNEVLGFLALGLLAIVVMLALVLAGREVLGFRRLRRIDRLRAQARAARTRPDALASANALIALYAPRAELRWQIDRLRDTLPDQLDAEDVLHVTEAHLLTPLDAHAIAQVEASARQVSLLTALIPMALVDVLAALVTNLRMIRRIAEIYGGRTGALGSLRLLRGVIAHLLATGAVAVGEDMLGSVASGGVMSKLSRRFGEGIVNGALTARLGIAAIEVCRPLPFVATPRPRTSAIMRRAVSGLFDKAAPEGVQKG